MNTRAQRDRISEDMRGSNRKVTVIIATKRIKEVAEVTKGAAMCIQKDSETPFGRGERWKQLACPM